MLLSSNPRFSADPRVERSLRHAVRDGVGYSIMSGAGETYFAAYALFLGATAAQISLLAALPPLFGALTQLLAAWLEARVGRRRLLILTGVLMQAFTWLPIIWLPYLFPAHAVPVMVSCIVMYYGWVGFSSPLWSSLMGELVPSRKRGCFFGDRTQLMSMASFVALVAAGMTLQFFELRDDAQLAFVLIFTAAAAARLCSTYHLAQVHEPEAEPQRLPSAPPPAPLPIHFVSFSIFAAAMSFAVAVAGPFFSVYMLKDLEFSYLQFMAATAAAVLAQFVSLRAWGRLADLYGSRAILAVAGLLVPLAPLLWLLSPAFGWVLGVQALAGWAWGGFGLALGNYLYEVAPPAQRARYCAMHNLVSAVGAGLGALLGGVLSTKLPPSVEILGHTLQWKSGLWALILLSALLRALALLAFFTGVEKVRRRRAFSTRVFLVAMLRFNPLGDFVCRRLRRRRRCAASLISLDA